MIKLILEDKFYEVEQFTFSGGEVQIRIDPTVNYIVDVIMVSAQIRSSDDLMALLLVKDALDFRTNSETEIALRIQYFPYARQDRRCVDGEAHSMNVISRLINSMKFDIVQISDIHNEETLNLINNVDHRPQHLSVGNLVDAYDFVCAPDKGALPKLKNHPQYPHLNPDAITNPFNVVIAEKVRDPKTGQITETKLISTQNLKDKSVLIVDDICDGGRTFIELAKVLRAEGANRIGLHVTHGIFSKGLDVLEDLIDNIYTTDSFYEGDSK